MEEAIRHVDSGEEVQPPNLPFELLHLIAQFAISTAIKEKDRETLKTFSFVFSGWRVPFQRALFKIKIPCLRFSEFTAIYERSPISDLRDLLDVNPDFQQAITSLDLRVLGTGTLRGAAPDFTASLLSRLMSLDTVWISQAHQLGRDHSWTKLPEEVQDSLTVLFRSPSIRHLNIWSFDAPLAVTFPEGAERHAVNISCSRSPGLQDDAYSNLFDGSDLGEWDATVATSGHSRRPCTVRHLESTTSIASRLLRAIRPSQAGTGTPFIDSSSIYSVDMTMKDHGELQDLHTILHRTKNLQKLIVRGAYIFLSLHEAHFSSAPGGGVNELFKEPQLRCLANLEEIDLTFNCISDSESVIKAIIREFSIYPPQNVLRNVVMKIPSFKRVFIPPLVEKLYDELVELAGLFAKKCRFPLLECVEVEPELGPVVDEWDWWDRGNNVAYLAKILEKVMMQVNKIGLGYKFSVRPSEDDMASIPHWAVN